MTIRKTALTIALAALFAAGGTAVAQSYETVPGRRVPSARSARGRLAATDCRPTGQRQTRRRRRVG